MKFKHFYIFLLLSLLWGCKDYSFINLNRRGSLTFNGNGNESGVVPESRMLQESETILTPSSGDLAWSGMVFHNWNTARNGSGEHYFIDDEFTMLGYDVTLYAQWIPETTPTYTLTYYGNGNTGGTAPADTNNYELNEPIIIHNQGTLIKNGHIFDSWNAISDGSGIRYTSGETFIITGNTSLYAQWTEQPYIVISGGVYNYFPRNSTGQAEDFEVSGYYDMGVGEVLRSQTASPYYFALDPDPSYNRHWYRKDNGDGTYMVLVFALHVGGYTLAKVTGDPSTFENVIYEYKATIQNWSSKKEVDGEYYVDDSNEYITLYN